MKTYAEAELAAQPIGYWTGAAYRAVVAAVPTDVTLRTDML